MKKTYSQPKLEVVFVGKDITTDVITVSNQTYGAGVGEKVYAPGVRDLDDSWANAGY